MENIQFCEGCRSEHHAVLWFYRDSEHGRRYICLDAYVLQPSQQREIWGKELSFK